MPFEGGKVTGPGPQKFATFEIRVYQRVGGEERGGWFSTEGGGASWNGHRLQIEFNGSDPDAFLQGQLSLDLICQTPSVVANLAIYALQQVRMRPLSHGRSCCAWMSGRQMLSFASTHSGEDDEADAAKMAR